MDQMAKEAVNKYFSDLHKYIFDGLKSWKKR